MDELNKNSISYKIQKNPFLLGLFVIVIAIVLVEQVHNIICQSPQTTFISKITTYTKPECDAKWIMRKHIFSTFHHRWRIKSLSILFYQCFTLVPPHIILLIKQKQTSAKPYKRYLANCITSMHRLSRICILLILGHHESDLNERQRFMRSARGTRVSR